MRPAKSTPIAAAVLALLAAGAAAGSDYAINRMSNGGFEVVCSTEYKRGYNDALKGNAFDQDRHPQAYKDGYRAGENAR